MASLELEVLNDKLQNLKDWKFEQNTIVKEFKLKDFKTALNFVNNIGDEAEKADHHPEIFIHSWNKVKITLSTHSEGGVTEKDIALADKIEKLKK